MKKSIVKCLKMIVAVFLIWSMVIPSFASISASDGSSFVTKAEFDSALADFNSRLTTFEAGINSKIDSQVTSYLDRNGIWSGKEQALVNNKIKIGGGALAGWTLKGESSAFSSAWNERVIIENITKSGLAYIYVTLNRDRSTLAYGGELGIYTDEARTVTCTANDPNSDLGRVASRSSWSGSFVFQQKNGTSYYGDKAYLTGGVSASFSLLPKTNSTARQLAYGHAYISGNYVIQLFVANRNALWTYWEQAYAPGRFGSSYFGALNWNMPTYNVGCSDTAAAGANCPVYNYIEKIIVY